MDTNFFEVTPEEHDNIQILNLNGYLDAHTAPQLESAIGKTVKSGKNNLLIDFHKLEYISSAGLGVFMEFIEDIRKNGGDIKMSNLKPKVFSVFELLGFPVLFDILPEREDAIKRFQSLKLKAFPEQ